MNIKKAEVTAFLKNYAAALSTGDLNSISAAWHIPSLLVGQKGSIAVSKAKEVEGFFKQAVETYHKSGIASVKLESTDVTKLSKGVVTANVTRRQVRSDGRSGKAERSFYVLSKQGLLGKIGIDLVTQVDGI